MNLLKKKYEMVKYWKTQEAVEAKVTVAPEGHAIMWMQGEKYPFPGFPRGSLLYGKLSPLKHEIKNQIFNKIWYALEEKASTDGIMFNFLNITLPNIARLAENCRYDMVPPEKMVPPVKEIYRAMTKIIEKTGSKNMEMIRDIFTFILQEDDAYRFRIQDLAQYMEEGEGNNLERLSWAFTQLEHAETVGDMKERERLWKRGFLFLLTQPGIDLMFKMLCDELDWKKLYLTKADKYFFRAKYYKVDRREYDY